MSKVLFFERFFFILFFAVLQGEKERVKREGGTG